MPVRTDVDRTWSVLANSFSTVLELLDPYRFTAGTEGPRQECAGAGDGAAPQGGHPGGAGWVSAPRDRPARARRAAGGYSRTRALTLSRRLPDSARVAVGR